MFAAVLACASLIASSCNSEPEGSGLDCFPEEARRWIARTGAEQGFGDGQSARAAEGPVSVYVDASGSMAGYLDGATEARKPFQDLIATVPDLFPAATSPVSFRAFGSRIRDVPRGQQNRLMQRDFYSCSGQPAAACDNQDTRLDLVMSAVEAERDRLAVVITDMWFADPSSATTGLVPLARPLENILASGRTIAVYGIRAPYRGTIYDLPGGQSTAFEGDRPLIVLAIGDPERVRQFGEKLSRSSSHYLMESFRTGASRQSIFTTNPALPARREEAPLSGGTDPRVKRAVVMGAIEGVRLQQLSISRSEALRPAQGNVAAPAWEGPSDEAFVPHAVWRGPLVTRTRVWERRGEQCVATDWPREPASYGGGWSEAGTGRRRFALDATEFVGAFRRPAIYLVTAELARNALEQPNPETAWLRDWSFSANQGVAAARAGDGTFFRTLHLSEFARLLENSLTEAAQRNPRPLMGIAFAVQVTD